MKQYGKALPLLSALFVACSSPSPVDEIVDSNIAARGGQERIQAVRSFRATGTATASGGRAAQVVYEIKQPGLFRLEFSSQGMKSVFASDGKISWEVDPPDGQFEPQQITSESDSRMGIEERDIEGHLVNWREKMHLVELVGREALADGEAFKLKVTLENGSIRHDYIDVASRQIVRSDIPRRIHGHDVVLVKTYSDFREVDGLIFPHLIQTRVKDRPDVITITVETTELNPDLDDARFRFPG